MVPNLAPSSFSLFPPPNLPEGAEAFSRQVLCPLASQLFHSSAAR
jgi:hypothetical protein